MNPKKNVVILSFFVIFLLISFVSSATTIQVKENPEPEKKSFFNTYFGFLKSPIFWYIIGGLMIFIIFLILIFFLVRWIITFLRSRNDIFYKLKSERTHLSRIQKSYPSKHWWKVYKNTPIRLVKRSDDNRMIITEPIGYHRGDYTSHEGNLIINLNLKDKKKWFIFPISDILVIPNKEKIDLEQFDEKGKKIKITILNIPKARDIIQFNSNEILIYAEGLSHIGLFLTPVLKTKDNKIMDLSLPIFQSLKDVVLGDFLYQQTSDFSNLAKKSMDINPFVRVQTKVQDATQNVEVPSDNR